MSQGHIRRSGAKWVAVVELPRHPETGKRRQKWLRATTKREVMRLRTELIDQINQGNFAEPTREIKLKEFVPLWLEETSHRVEPTTLETYESSVRVHIVPALGNLVIQKIRPIDIQQMFRDERARGTREPTLAAAHFVLNAVFKWAVRLELVRTNPCTAIQRPVVVPRGKTAWEPETIALVHETWNDPETRGVVRLALYTGMRRGELMGLRWSDVDFTREEISVEQAVRSRRGGNLEIAKPKTHAGTRVVPLRKPAVELLRGIRVEQLERRLVIGEAWRDLDLVFDRGDGMPEKPNNVTDRFDQHVARLKLPRITFHELRHTSVTEMLRSGMSLSQVGKIVGHSIITMTWKYQHIQVDELHELMDRMDAQR